MRLADGALYRAKRSGRNRCVVYSSFVDAPLSLKEEAERARSAGLANTVYALARAVDLKDGYTHQHSARVAQYAAVLARELGMSEEEIEQIRTAGILHDVGKVGVADAVLLKPARLTEDEFLEMQRHSEPGPRHRPGRRHAGDRRVGAVPARALGRPRLSAEARGRGDPAREPRAGRRRRVRGDDLVAPVPPRHAGREGAGGAREVSRHAVRPERRPADGRPRSAQARSRSARSACSTSRTTARRRAPAAAAPPEEEGEPVRNVPSSDGVPRGARRDRARIRQRLQARAPAPPADRAPRRPRPSRSSPRTRRAPAQELLDLALVPVARARRRRAARACAGARRTPAPSRATWRGTRSPPP